MGDTANQPGANNQLRSDGTWTYTYDAEGNLIKKSKGQNAETWTYRYDNQNQMISAKDQATDGGTTLTLATYTYDVFGNRIEKDVWTASSNQTVVQRYAYDDQYLCTAGQLFFTATGRYRMLADLRGWLHRTRGLQNFTAKPYDLATLLEPTEGTVRVCGHDPHSEPDAEAARAALALVPDTPMLYDDLTVRQHLSLVALAHGVTDDAIGERIDTLLERGKGYR